MPIHNYQPSKQINFNKYTNGRPMSGSKNLILNKECSGGRSSIHFLNLFSRRFPTLNKIVLGDGKIKQIVYFIKRDWRLSACRIWKVVY